MTSSTLAFDLARITLGEHADSVLAFWAHLEKMTETDWRKVHSTAASSKDQVESWVPSISAAREAAIQASSHVAQKSGWKATFDVMFQMLHCPPFVAFLLAGIAANAANEIQGASVLRAQGKPFVFLPMFGIAAPEDLLQNTAPTAEVEL